MFFVELVAQSLVQGSIYALIALGLTLVYGLLRILHVAHASLFTLGAYIGVLTYNATGSMLLTLLAAMAVSGLSGVAMFRLAYQPILKQPPHVALIASIGLFIAAEECFRIVFGASGLSFANPPLQAQVQLFGGLQFKQAELAVMLGTPMISAVPSITASSACLNCNPPNSCTCACSGGLANDRPEAPKTMRKHSSAAMNRPMEAINATCGGCFRMGW